MMKITVSAGHAEYDIDPKAVSGLSITTVWPTAESEEERWDWDEDQAEAAYRAAVPDGPDVDPMWEYVQVWGGDRDAIERGLTALIDMVDCVPGGDDDTFDYWPSGVRYAADIADVLGGEWPDKVEEVARRVITVHKSQTAEELLSKVGYE